VSWTLFALATSPSVQAKLRAELRGCLTDTPDFDTLNDLQYLDAVFREALRLYSPVSSTQRVATKDDVIPLGESVLDKKGRVMTEIRIGKGDAIRIPIRILNRSVEIWGDDASEFR